MWYKRDGPLLHYFNKDALKKSSNLKIRKPVVFQY